MNWFKKLFKKEKTYNTDYKFKLCIINDDTELLHEALGVTEERSKELLEVALKAYDNNKTLTDSYAEMLESCKHINEVIMIMNMFNRIHEIKSKDTGLMGFLGKILGNNEC